MKSHFLAIQSAILSLSFCGLALAAPTFQDLNNLPQLGCKIPVYKGVINPAGVASGKGGGGVDTAPVHAAPNVKGRGIWSQTPPSDNINTVNLAIAIPAVDTTVYGQARVEIPGGYIWSMPTHIKISVFKGNMVGALESNTVITGEEIASSMLPEFNPQNFVSAGLTATVERAVANGDFWTVVVQEIRNAPNPTTSNPNWSQISTACELKVSNLL
jgi:hypothetical protein